MHQPGEELSDSDSVFGLPRDETSDVSFEGFPDSQTCPEALISHARFLVLSLGMRLQTCPLRVFPTPKRVLKLSSLMQGFLSCRAHPLQDWRQLLVVMSSMSALIPGSRLRMRALQLRLSVAGPGLLDSTEVYWDDSCLEDLRWWSVESHLLAGCPFNLSFPELALFTDASDTGWGASLGDDRFSGLWPHHCSLFSTNHRELLAVLYAIQGFLPLLRSHSSSLYADNTTALSYLRKEGGTRSATQCCGSVDPEILRGASNLSGARVYSWSPQCARRLFQSPVSSSGFGVDSLSAGLSGGPSLMACDEPQPSSPGLFLADV